MDARLSKASWKWHECQNKLGAIRNCWLRHAWPGWEIVMAMGDRGTLARPDSRRTLSRQIPVGFHGPRSGPGKKLAKGRSVVNSALENDTAVAASEQHGDGNGAA